jgi:threonine dehydratase
VAYVPIGMGSGVSAGAAVRNGLGLKTKLVGVVSAHAPCYGLSFEAKECVEAPAQTKIADGLGCRKPEETALQIILENVDHVAQVSDEAVSAAMRHYFSDTHSAVEGAGAAALAGALQEKQ